MTRSGEGRKIEAALVGAGCTVHDADDLGESKWDIAETQSSAFAHTACDDDDDEHEPFTCTMFYDDVPCCGQVEWRQYDGYRCQSCDQPYNEDGTVWQA